MEVELRVPIHGVPYDTCLGPLKDIFETKLESAQVTKIGDAKRREGFCKRHSERFMFLPAYESALAMTAPEPCLGVDRCRLGRGPCWSGLLTT